jgi:hypothetical protein
MSDLGTWGERHARRALPQPVEKTRKNMIPTLAEGRGAKRKKEKKFRKSFLDLLFPSRELMKIFTVGYSRSFFRTFAIVLVGIPNIDGWWKIIDFCTRT